jgi:hypothetical protein
MPVDYDGRSGRRARSGRRRALVAMVAVSLTWLYFGAARAGPIDYGFSANASATFVGVGVEAISGSFAVDPLTGVASNIVVNLVGMPVTESFTLASFPTLPNNLIQAFAANGDEMDMNFNQALTLSADDPFSVVRVFIGNPLVAIYQTNNAPGDNVQGAAVPQVARIAEPGTVAVIGAALALLAIAGRANSRRIG